MSDQCRHCLNRTGKRELCGTKDLPCSIPESWYVDALRTEIAFYRKRACCDPGNKREHTQACLDNVALLMQIMNDLPSNRDWLDPDLERMARSAIEERKGMIENDWIKEHVKLKAEIERLNRLINIVVANAVISPDARMNGTTDCYHVPLDDIEALKEAIG